jgi:hypothetical protein
MIAFTQQMAIQNAEYGIRANVILPGLMDTPMAVDTRARHSGKPRAEVAAARDAKVPLRGKMGTPWDCRSMAARWYGLVSQHRSRQRARLDGGAIAGKMRFRPPHQIFTVCVRGYGSGVRPGSMLRGLVDREGVHGTVRLRAAAARIGILASMLAALAGCSSLSDSSFTVFADPGKYTYYSCDQINAQTKQWTNREQELRTLMDKAEQSTGGAMVNVLAYRADYFAATEELKVLEKTARTKNCNAPPNWGSNSAIR